MKLSTFSVIIFVTFISQACPILELSPHLCTQEVGLDVALQLEFSYILWTSLCHGRDLSLPRCRSSYMYTLPLNVGNSGKSLILYFKKGREILMRTFCTAHSLLVLKNKGSFSTITDI